MEREQMVEKLRKLFALANDRAATEGEARNAMAKAQQLLALHNLSMSDVEVQIEKTGEESIHVGKKPWAVYLYSSAAKICFCKVFRTGKSISIVGKPTDIIATRCLAEYLLNTGERLTKEVPSAGSARHAFKLGFAHRIWERANELVRMAKENKLREEGTNRELILHPIYSRSEKEIAIYLAQRGIRLASPKHRSQISNRDAYSQGRNAGNSVSLTRNTIGQGVKGIGYNK